MPARPTFPSLHSYSKIGPLVAPIGIATDQQQKIFEMFQRVEMSFEGTGIGLAIVKKAVERMGGKVGVESEVEKGSTFWVELQRAQVQVGGGATAITGGGNELSDAAIKVFRP